MSDCKVSDCTKPVHVAGFCAMHNWRIKKYNSIDLPEKENIYEQKCSVCKEVKPLDYFHKQSSRKIGVMSRCKICNSKRAKQWNEENKERSKHLRREAYKKFSQEQRKQKLKNNREYYKRNSQKMNDRGKKYRKENPWQKINSEGRRRARKQNNGVYIILPKEINKIYSSPCIQCGSKDNITLDHIIPISRGGKHSIGNLQALCKSCNSSKGSRLNIEWKHHQMI